MRQMLPDGLRQAAAVDTMLEGMVVGWLLLSSLLAAADARMLTSWDSACQFGYTTLMAYDGSLMTEQNCGATYTRSIWRRPPSVYSRGVQGEKYVVLMLDPDAPNLTQGCYHVHFLATNVDGFDLTKGDFSKADILAGYMPPNRIGDRYMIVTYKQAHPEEWITASYLRRRDRFHLQSWLDGLKTKLCGPRSGAQFQIHR